MQTGVYYSQSPLRKMEDLSYATEEPPKDICFKIFIVATIVLATLVVVIGILALMAVKGALPVGFKAISNLNLIGEVNSYVMVGGGITLFVLGILAWYCQIRKENRESLSHVPRERLLF